MISTKRILTNAIGFTLILLALLVFLELLLNCIFGLIYNNHFGVTLTVFLYSTIATILFCTPITFIWTLKLSIDFEYTEAANSLLSKEKETKVMPIKSNNNLYKDFDIITLPNIANFYAILSDEENSVKVKIIFNDSKESYLYDKQPKEDFLGYYSIIE